MQFSLPVLPYGPGAPKAAGNPASPSRLNEANSPATGANFGDLLPLDPSGGKSARLAVSKRPMQAGEEPDDEQLEKSGDDSQTTATNGSPENWMMGSGMAPRFVTDLPPAAQELGATGEEATGETSEGTGTISTETDGGKATGLTRPMPENAQGDGRARAILHRAERASAVLLQTRGDAAISNARTDGTSAQAVEPTPPSPATVTEMNALADSSDFGTAVESAMDSNPTANPTTPSGFAPTSASQALTDPAVVGATAKPGNPTESRDLANEVATQQSEKSTNVSVDDSFAGPVTSGLSQDPSMTVTSSANGESPISAPANPTPTVVAAESASAEQATSESSPAMTEVVPPVSDGAAEPTLSSRGSGVSSGKTFPRVSAEQSGASLGLDLATEKFAGGTERPRSAIGSRENRAELKSFGSAVEALTDKLNRLGINVAESGLSMAAPATSPNAHSTLPGVESMSTVSAAAGLGGAQGDELQRSASSSAAQRAVESAVAVAEHFSNGDRRSVSLQFSVSGVDLSVRVELRGTAVHTTFRTDSPELRAALAHEWQVVNAQPADRAVRLADPVFASNSSNASVQADAGSHQQRETGAQAGRFENPPFAGFRSPNRASTSAAPRVVAAVQESNFVSGRLRTFA